MMAAHRTWAARSSGSRTAARTSSPSNHARVDVATVKLALDDDGRILGAHLDHLEDAGAYPVGGDRRRRAVRRACCSRARTGSRRWVGGAASVWTNTCGRGAYRGPWMFETVAREQIVDLAARAIGHRPARAAPAQRRARRPSCRTPPPTGMPLDTVTPDGDARAGGRDPRLRRVPRRAGGARSQAGPAPRHRASASTSSRRAPARWTRSAPRPRPCASSPSGHGHGVRSAPARTARASRRRWRRSSPSTSVSTIDDVVVVQGDTDVDALRWRHRRQPHRGHRRQRVPRRVRCRCATRRSAIAAHLLEAAPEDLEMADGAVVGAGHAGAATSRSPRSRASRTRRGPSCRPASPPVLEATGRYQAPPMTWSNACHVCTVEVDRAHRARSKCCATS